MKKIYIEVSGGVVQNVYTDSKRELEVILCDHDDEESEQRYQEFDYASKACKELEKKREKLKLIF